MEAKKTAAVNSRKLHLRPEPGAVPTARQAFMDLELDLDPGLLFDASLCVSELVATSVREDVGDGEETLELELSVSDETLSAAVRARRLIGKTIERVNGTSVEDDLGLYIISRLADRYGLDPVESRIWFEFDVAGRARARSPAFEAESSGSSPTITTQGTHGR
jgi:hypothetical protein